MAAAWLRGRRRPLTRMGDDMTPPTTRPTAAMIPRLARALLLSGAVVLVSAFEAGCRCPDASFPKGAPYDATVVAVDSLPNPCGAGSSMFDRRRREGPRRYSFAPLQQRDATTHEIEAIVTRMADAKSRT